MSDRAIHNLDEVAAYALGTTRGDSASSVRAHLRDCAECRAEYDRLRPVVTTLGVEAQAAPSPLLKARIMRHVRESIAREPYRPPVAVARRRVWPAYAAAAAAVVLAIISTISNISLNDRLRTAQSQLAQAQSERTSLDEKLASEHAMVADIMSADAHRMPVHDGQIVMHKTHLYIALHSVPMPKHGMMYEAWTVPKGTKNPRPSVMFMPDKNGLAIVELPENATQVAAVSITLEPSTGSKTPSGKPIARVTI